MTNIKKKTVAEKKTVSYQDIILKLTALLNKDIVVADFFEEAADIITANESLREHIGLFVSIDLKSAVKIFSRNLTEQEEDEISSKCASIKSEQSDNFFLMPLKLNEAKGYLGAVSKDGLFFSSHEFNLFKTFAELMRCKFAMCRKDMLISAENDTNDSAENLEKFFSAFPNLPPEMYSKTILDEIKRITKCGVSYACLFDKKGNIFSENISADSETSKKAVKEASRAAIYSILDGNKPNLKPQASKGILKDCTTAPVFYSGKITGLLMIANPAQAFGPRISRILNRMTRLYSLLMTHKIELRKNAIKTAENNSILSTTWDLIFTLNTEGQITYISPSVEKMGYTVEEVEGHNFREFVPEEDIPRLNAKMEHVLATGMTSPVYTYRILKKDGTILLTQLKIVLNKVDGVPVSISAILRDISDDIKHLRKLHEMQLLYETMFSKSPFAIFIVNAADLTLMRANKNASKLFGFGTTEGAGKDIFSLFADNAKEDMRLLMEKNIEKAQNAAKDSYTFSKRTIIKGEEGKEIPAILSFTYLNTENSDQPALLAIAEDLSAEARRKEEIGLRLAMFNNTPDYIYAVDLKSGNIVFANKTICAEFNTTPREIEGSPLYKIFNSKEDARKKLERLRATPKLHEKLSIYSKAGDLIELESFSARAKLGGREIAIISSRDIGLQLDMERELQKTNATLSSILSSLPDYVQLLDSKKSLQYENRCIILGTPGGREKILSHYDPAKQHRKYIEQVLKTGIPLSFMEDLPLPENKSGTFEHRIIPIHDPQGKVSGAGIITRDYTAEREKHEKIRELEFILEHIFGTSKDMIYVMDRSGRYIMINQSAAMMFGKTAESMRGKTNAELHLEENSVPVSELKEAFVKKTPLFFTRMHTYPMGTRFESISCSPVINEAGESTSVIVVARDITQEHIETTKKAISGAKESVSVKMRPVGHDFNNILTVINGYATLLSETAKGDSRIAAGLRQILKAVERATKLTAQFQNYARNPEIEMPESESDKAKKDDNGPINID